jgi:hypothetical protein
LGAHTALGSIFYKRESIKENIARMVLERKRSNEDLDPADGLLLSKWREEINF